MKPTAQGRKRLVLAMAAAGCGLVGALISAAGAPGPPARAEPQVPKTEAARQLAQELVDRIDSLHFSYARKNAPGFDATFKVAREGKDLGTVRAQWDAEKGRLTVSAALKPRDLEERVKELTQTGLDEALLSYFSGPGVYAVKSAEGYVMADYSGATEGLKTQTLFISADLSEVRTVARFVDDSQRESIARTRAVQGRHYLETLTIALSAPQAPERRVSCTFAYGVKDKYPFVRQATIVEASGDSKTEWTLTEPTLSFIEPAAQTTSPARTGKVARVSIQETSLGKRPEGEVSQSMVISPALDRVVFRAEREGKKYLFVNGQSSPAYEVCDPPAFTPGGQRLLCRLRRDGKNFLRVDGEEHGPFEGIGVPAASPDGRRWAYVVQTGGKCYLVENDKQDPTPRDGIGPLVFSEDGKHLAYQIKVGSGMAVVLDGKPGKTYKQVSTPQFAPKTGHLCHGAESGAGLLYVWKGQESRAFERVGSPHFSPDGERLAFCAEPGSGQVLVTDATDGGRLEVGERYDHINSESLTFSPDGRRLAYEAERDKQTWLVAPEKEYGPYRSILHIGFDPQGRAAFVGSQGLSEYFPVVGGTKGAVCDDVGQPVFGPDGRTAMYYLRRGEQWFVMANDKRLGPYTKVYDPTIGPGNRHVVFRAERGEKSLHVVDGKEEKTYKYVFDLCFSADGSRYAYRGVDEAASRVVVDGIERKPYDDVLHGPEFTPDGRDVMYTAKRGGKMFLVVGEAEGKPYDFVDWPVRGPDGSRLACVAKRGEKHLFVVDGLESPEVEGTVMRGPVFITPTALRLVVLRDKEFFLIEAQILDQ